MSTPTAPTTKHTPSPAAFVPRDASERAAVVALVRTAMHRAYRAAGRGVGGNYWHGTDHEPEMLVPPVPTRKRVVTLYGLLEATFQKIDEHGAVRFQTTDHATRGTGRHTFESIIAMAPQELRTRVAKKLLDLIANPDEPSPAAPGVRALTFTEYKHLRDLMTRDFTGHYSDLDAANAYLASLFGQPHAGREVGDAELVALRTLDYRELTRLRDDLSAVVGRGFTTNAKDQREGNAILRAALTTPREVGK